ncbi:MAG: GNAT family N-acetyltransferase [Pseudomonadota bacterium]
MSAYRAMNAVFSDAFDEPATYADLPPTDAYADRWLANPDNVAVIAEKDGEAVGALAGYVLHKFEQDCAELYIYDIAVLDEHRRKGVASALLDETRRIARENGAWTIFVQAEEGDAPPLALYRKQSVRELVAHHFDLHP